MFWLIHWFHFCVWGGGVYQSDHCNFISISISEWINEFRIKKKKTDLLTFPAALLETKLRLNEAANKGPKRQNLGITTIYGYIGCISSMIMCYGKRNRHRGSLNICMRSIRYLMFLVEYYCFFLYDSRISGSESDFFSIAKVILRTLFFQFTLNGFESPEVSVFVYCYWHWNSPVVWSISTPGLEVWYLDSVKLWLLPCHYQWWKKF